MSKILAELSSSLQVAAIIFKLGMNFTVVIGRLNGVPVSEYPHEIF